MSITSGKHTLDNHKLKLVEPVNHDILNQKMTIQNVNISVNQNIFKSLCS